MPSYRRLRNAEFLSDNFKLIFGRDLGMPFVLALGKVDSFAFDSVGDDHRWLIGISRRLRALQGRDNLREVVTVDLEATPAKLLKYAPQIDPRPRITAVATMLLIDCKHPTELLQAIPVQNGGKISQL